MIILRKRQKLSFQGLQFSQDWWYQLIDLIVDAILMFKDYIYYLATKNYFLLVKAGWRKDFFDLNIHFFGGILSQTRHRQTFTIGTNYCFGKYENLYMRTMAANIRIELSEKWLKMKTAFFTTTKTFAIHVISQIYTT